MRKDRCVNNGYARKDGAILPGLLIVSRECDTSLESSRYVEYHCSVINSEVPTHNQQVEAKDRVWNRAARMLSL